MNIRHHLDNATLARYAAGELDEAFSLVVASHLAVCDVCRAELRRAESVGGALLEELEPEPMNSSSLEFALSQLDAPEARTRAQTSPKPAGSDIPFPLQRHIGGSLKDIRWKTIAPGVGKYDLQTSPGAKGSAYLIRLMPGKAMPEHGHGGDELTLVLQGSYRDSFGQFAVGDIADLDETVEHTPRVDSDIPCICLAATDQPTRFKGLIARLLQPMFGI